MELAEKSRQKENDYCDDYYKIKRKCFTSRVNLASPSKLTVDKSRGMVDKSKNISFIENKVDHFKDIRKSQSTLHVF